MYDTVNLIKKRSIIDPPGFFSGGSIRTARVPLAMSKVCDSYPRDSGSRLGNSVARAERNS